MKTTEHNCFALYKRNFYHLFRFTILPVSILLCLAVNGHSQKSTFQNIHVQIDSSLQVLGITLKSNDFDSIVLAVEIYFDKLKAGNLNSAEANWGMEEFHNQYVKKDSWTFKEYKEAHQKFIDDTNIEMKSDPYYQTKFIKTKEFFKKLGKSSFIYNDAFSAKICSDSKRDANYNAITIKKYKNTWNHHQTNTDMLIIQVRGMISQFKNPQILCDEYGKSAEIYLGLFENKWQVIGISNVFFKLF